MKNILFRALLLLTIVSLSQLSANAMLGTGGILDGKVVDKASGDPLVNVTVLILGTTIGTVTDLEGNYQLLNVFHGTYDLQFSIVGYKSVIMKAVDVAVDRRTRVDVVLEASAIEMQPVIIVSKHAMIAQDVPATVYSMSDIKLEQLPVTSFQEIMALQPGITIEGNVRGGRTTEVLYLIDGLPVQDVISGGMGTEIPKSSISDMTIYTGGFDVEYGNALSGVVNVVTKSGGDEHKFGVRVEKDNWLPSRLDKQVDRRTEAEVSAKGPVLAKELYYYTANLIRLSDTRWWQDMRSAFDSPISKELFGTSKLEYVAPSNERITLQGIYSTNSWRDYEFTWRYNLSGLPQRKKDSYRLALSVSGTIGTNSAYTLSASRFYQRNHIGVDSKTDIIINPYQYDIYLRYIVSGTRNWWADSRQVVYTLKSNYSYQFTKLHVLKLGAEYNLYDIASDLVKYEPQTTYFGKPIETAPLLNYSNTYSYFPRSGSAFVQDKVEFKRDGATLNVGLRWDFLDPRAKRPIVDFIPTRPNEFKDTLTGMVKAKLKDQVSLRMAFATPTGPGSIFFANFGQYFQFPLFDYLYSGINPAQLRGEAKSVLAGNPDLLPERTTAWEVGYKHTIKDLYVGSITYFDKQTFNQIDTKTLVAFDSKFAGDYGFASYVNNAEAHATGVEVAISRERDDRLTGSISYVYTIAEGSSETVDQAVNFAQWGFPITGNTYPLSWDQRHTVKIDGNFKTFWGIESNLIVMFNSPRPYTFYPTRDGFTPADKTRPFLPNNARMESVVFVNLKVSKSFRYDELGKTSFVVYADIRNLMNVKNVRWIDSNGRIGGELSDPGAYYDPRRVRVGIQADL